MDKVRASLLACLPAIGSSLALALLLVAGCAKSGGDTPPLTCGSGQTICGSACFDLKSDAQHCGSCDKACSTGQNCVNSACACASGYTLCGGTCVATGNDFNHCGSCTNACTGSQVCSNGSCSSTGCSGGTTACSGGCVNQQTDLANCGSCGHACLSGQSCTSGACTGGGQGGTPGGQGGMTGGGTAGTTGGGTGGRGGTTGTAGTTGGQGGFTGATPAGYWTSGTWHGCAWTGIDTVTKPPHRTTITPMDFTNQAAGAAYHVTGSVGLDPPVPAMNYTGYGGVALLGFNLNQPAQGASCIYDAATATAVGPPEVSFPTGPTGIAVNFSKTSGTKTVRIQIQGKNGATDPNNRWCFALTNSQGKGFAPFNLFYTACYFDDGAGNSITGQSHGNRYNGEPISAVVFLVPGDAAADLLYDFTVNGFALGTSAADAPDGGTVGTLTGTIGGADPTPNGTAIDFQRVKVTGADLHSYIIQNDNWGNPTGTDQTLTYTNNSFKISSIVGGDLGAGSVRSFPSIYVGANGNTMAGTYSTSSDDHLPKLISTIQTANTTFTWSGGTAGGNYNATYDVWFAADAPAATPPYYPVYQDGKSGFLMVWFYKPGANGPIGTIRRTATIGGKTFNVYSGPRATGPSPNAPVVSYVAQTAITDWTYDLNLFIKDAVTNRAMDANGGILPAWYLTDVFAGFEIWNGANANGLTVNKFTFDLK